MKSNERIVGFRLYGSRFLYQSAFKRITNRKEREGRDLRLALFALFAVKEHMLERGLVLYVWAYTKVIVACGNLVRSFNETMPSVAKPRNIVCYNTHTSI